MQGTIFHPPASIACQHNTAILISWPQWGLPVKWGCAPWRSDDGIFLALLREIIVATFPTFGQLNWYGSEMLLHSCLKRMSKYGAAASIRGIYTDAQYAWRIGAPQLLVRIVVTSPSLLAIMGASVNTASFVFGHGLFVLGTDSQAAKLSCFPPINGGC